MSDKGLVCRIAKELSKVSNKKINNPMFLKLKMRKRLKRHFRSEGIQMASTHRKKCQHHYYKGNHNEVPLNAYRNSPDYKA